MADKTFRLDVVAPDAKLYSGEASIVVAQTTVGQIGIMANHEPMLAELAAGGAVVLTDVDGNRKAMAVQGGFLSVTADTVTVLAESAQFAEEIDAAAERAALDSAEQGSEEYHRAQSRVRAVEAVS